MSVLMSVFLGFIQGAAEFLPISSSGHLSILQNLLNLSYSENDHMFFDVLLHLGTLMAVVVYYWKDIKSMAVDTVSFFSKKGKGEKRDDGRLTPNARSVLMIVIGTLPLLIVLPFYSKLELLYYNTAFIGFALIITGCLLYVSDKLSEGRKSDKTITVVDALLIGIGQAIAVIPGLSRSGTTITVGLSRGVERNYAVKFSFLLSIPAVLGSNLVSLIKALKDGVNWSYMPVYMLGMVAAALFGYLAIIVVNKLIKKQIFGKFSYYCWGIGVLAILLSIIL